MRKATIFKLIALLLYWGAVLAAGCIYGFGAAVLVVVGTAFASMVLAAESATGESETEGHDSCTGCRHDLGGGQCKINLEAECGKGEHEMWEDGK